MDVYKFSLYYYKGCTEQVVAENVERYSFIFLCSVGIWLLSVMFLL